MLQDAPSHFAIGPSVIRPSGLPAYDSLPAATTDPRYDARAETNGLPKAPNPCMRSVHAVGSIHSPADQAHAGRLDGTVRLMPRKLATGEESQEVGVRFATHPAA